MNIEKAIADLIAIRAKHGSDISVSITLADHYEGDTFDAVSFKVEERYDFDVGQGPYIVRPSEVL